MVCTRSQKEISRGAESTRADRIEAKYLLPGDQYCPTPDLSKGRFSNSHLSSSSVLYIAETLFGALIMKIR